MIRDTMMLTWSHCSDILLHTDQPHCWIHSCLHQNWSLPAQLPTKIKVKIFFVYRGYILLLQKYLLDSLNHIHIWQMSQQLSCGDTCQIWMWYSMGKKVLWGFYNTEKTRYVDGTPTSEVTPVTIQYTHPSHHGHTSQCIILSNFISHQSDQQFRR